MSGQRLAQMLHCLHCSGDFTMTFPVSRKANTSAGQKATQRPQFLHHASKISIGSVLSVSGKGTRFFRREGRDFVTSADTFFRTFTGRLSHQKQQSFPRPRGRRSACPTWSDTLMHFPPIRVYLYHLCPSPSRDFFTRSPLCVKKGDGAMGSVFRCDEPTNRVTQRVERIQASSAQGLSQAEPSWIAFKKGGYRGQTCWPADCPGGDCEVSSRARDSLLTLTSNQLGGLLLEFLDVPIVQLDGADHESSVLVLVAIRTSGDK